MLSARAVGFSLNRLRHAAVAMAACDMQSREPTAKVVAVMRLETKVAILETIYGATVQGNGGDLRGARARARESKNIRQRQRSSHQEKIIPS
jgi:hypothetical protein